jgi:hypothetical protein
VDDLNAVLELLGTSYFLTGVRLGSIALAIGWAIRFAWGRDKPPVPIGGVLVALAILGTLTRVEETVPAELPAIAVILVASFLARVLKAPLWVHPLAVLPGAIWLAFMTPVTDLVWARVLIAVMIPLAGFLITDFERRHGQLGLGVIFYTIAVFGAFAAVPDTEWAVALLAVVFPISFLAWPRVAVSIGLEGAYLAVAVFVWVIVQGGGGRPPSIIGSVACLGLLLLEPVIILLRPTAVKLTTWFSHNALGAVLASLPQFLIMVLCSRVAARFSSYLPAIIVVTFVYLTTVLVGVVVAEKAIRAEEEHYEDDPDAAAAGPGPGHDSLDPWLEKSDEPWP